MCSTVPDVVLFNNLVKVREVFFTTIDTTCPGYFAGNRTQ
ncbi:hypothetical protein TBC1_112260 [Lentimicrobium saccharophilum]|uniref:Uncharacterized protein n=1 Tax=Lentimicrobium saccharophilum TaxID=1678841 RepID=A0A0S7C521_9BACT|nr:hypothetical protein TBC1_112260 [Lentimicrobium saccharophilum]